MPDVFQPARRTVVIAAAGVLGSGALSACSLPGSDSGTTAQATDGGAAQTAATASAPADTSAPAATAATTATTEAPSPTGAPSSTAATTRPAATTKAPRATTTSAKPAATTKKPDPDPTTKKPEPSPTNVKPAGAIIQLSSIPVGSAVIRSGIVIAHTSGGGVRGFTDKCTHQGCAVQVSGSSLNCPCHGSRFSATSGAVQNGPAASPLAAVGLRVVNGWVVRG